MATSDRDTPWFHEGLRFGCTRCGNCCTGSPGTVLVSDAEIETLAAELELGVNAFRSRYTRRLRGAERSLIERRNGDCVFYRADAGCTVYAKRPRQCRTWPFWRSVVHARDRWHDEAKGCPGMNRGALLPRAAIEALAADDGTRASRRAKRGAPGTTRIGSSSPTRSGGA